MNTQKFIVKIILTKQIFIEYQDYLKYIPFKPFN